MVSLIELVPVEVARSITIHLHPEWLPNLLAASRAMRRTFAPGEDELLFVRKHLRQQFGDVGPITDPDWTRRIKMAEIVPFRKLPEVYAVAWLETCWEPGDPKDRPGIWRTKCSVRVIFPDLVPNPSSKHQEWRAPYRSIAWMEIIVLRALELQCLRIESPDECELVFSLASLFDSVAIAEAALGRLLPKEMHSEVEDSAAGADQVVMAVEWVYGQRRPVEAGKHEQHRFALYMAMVSMAEQAALNDDVQVLDFALQHPVAPVAFRFSRQFRSRDRDPSCDKSEYLINRACRRASMNAIHYLLGNPLPLAPPPASRGIRPGNLCGPDFEASLLQGLQGPRSDRESVLLSADNPVVTLTELAYGHPPLQNLLRLRDHDPLLAVTYLLDQGAPPNRIGEDTGPLHDAAMGKMGKVPGVVRLLVERGANIEDVELCGRSPLFLAAVNENAIGVSELLDRGADRDAACTSAGNRLGWTPLKMALYQKADEVARVLLRAGAR
ncbi:hypothetical protein HDU96_000439 [Phlyctochytrium bullatum]|nr:hypothetical protein HDU96_000439 [Phlyctochytrium bullatum]